MTETALLDLPSEVVDADLTAADAVWIAMALLQRSAGDERAFTTDEIAAKTAELRLTKADPRTIRLHVQQHCVANRPPQPNRACMLWATGKGNRRLARLSDRPHPERQGGRTHAPWHLLPKQFAHLKNWYENEWNAAHDRLDDDPLLALAGSGPDVWDGLSADDYVRSLRQGWGEAA